MYSGARPSWRLHTDAIWTLAVNLYSRVNVVNITPTSMSEGVLSGGRAPVQRFPAFGIFNLQRFPVLIETCAKISHTTERQQQCSGASLNNNLDKAKDRKQKICCGCVIMCNSGFKKVTLKHFQIMGKKNTTFFFFNFEHNSNRQHCWCLIIKLCSLLSLSQTTTF